MVLTGVSKQAISIFLINTGDVRATDFTAEANSLGQTIDLAIKMYEGIQV